MDFTRGDVMSNTGCCCSPANQNKSIVQSASTTLTLKDILGTVKVRLGIGRMGYTIAPGLYTVGNPNATSPVLVSANYKLTFDTLRKNLSGLDCWLLILDTKGVNVWCAAGKGTFGTGELIDRINTVDLPAIVSHRNLLLPQLGASGVSAHEVALRTDFSITFGPIRSDDIKGFIASGYAATKEMRTVKFTLLNRLILTPIELAAAVKASFVVFGALFLINLFASRLFGVNDLLAYAAAVLIGTVITPVLLPFVPGKAFAFKGWLLGIIGTTCIVWCYGWFSPSYWLLGIGYMLALPAYSAFLAMNFTGTSTYTSPSGVLREMKIAMPLIAVSLLLGIVLLLIKAFTG
ncbi:MAG: mercury methylation corrinoid protein HgcA [Dehalococcoidia bacterium]|nr:mercury methylation corrinoid protein HgcA [Dehalococcoidia bacterium]